MSFYDRFTEAQRFAFYRKLDEIQCAMPSPSGADTIIVPVGRGRYGDLAEAAQEHGLRVTDLYHFPLGSDKPAPHLRHDVRHGDQVFPSSNWLFAVLEPQ